MSLEISCSGRSVQDKLAFVRQFLVDVQSDYALFSSLDEIAWLFNIRGRDIPYNPLVISYAVVGKESAHLFVKTHKLNRETAEVLQQAGVETVDYHHLFLFLNALQEPAVFSLDPFSLNYAVYNRVASRFSVRENRSPVILEKAVKNPTETAGFRKACLQDGIALTRFFYWLEKTAGERNIRETEAAEQLAGFRSACGDYISDSFPTISAYGKNAALPHYSAIPGKDGVLERKGLYLLDSGGQYLYGTTDVTRTVPLGKLTQEERVDYTLVLKGMIALTNCLFPKGTSGAGFDVVARYALWRNKKNYGHGTGHGIGHFLCVHEGPQEIRQNWKEQPFLPGMVTSNEPAVYLEGQYGIRHENMLLCTDEGSNAFGEWLGFETLTLCYFDTDPLLPELLTEEEKKWLNNYHALVFDRLSPFLTSEESAWLKTKTAPV
jgi:Xaa-Pro aminopeptidase